MAAAAMWRNTETNASRDKKSLGSWIGFGFCGLATPTLCNGSGRWLCKEGRGWKMGNALKSKRCGFTQSHLGYGNQDIEKTS